MSLVPLWMASCVQNQLGGRGCNSSTRLNESQKILYFEVNMKTLVPHAFYETSCYSSKNSIVTYIARKLHSIDPPSSKKITFSLQYNFLYEPAVVWPTIFASYQEY